MDALKLMTEGMVKETNPAIRVGDVVKVHVKIREGERERIQVLKEQSLLARVAVFQKLSLYVVFHTVLVLKEYSLLIHQTLQR